ncbi:MAG: UTP--glucose-1-phosphate uridylyltransferase, partial [Solirubrobacterales bacterium]|nr:UTP--glucose-1-phosphate uridylyltransferase [Solirubrobacterales bacterium]
MRAAGEPEEAIAAFRRAYERFVAGESALLESAELEPVSDVPALEDLAAADARALEGVAVVKLNGGLATTMGLRQPKSLVEVREGRTFLDIIIGQIVSLRRRYGIRLPLVLMNSEVTREQTLRALRDRPQRGDELPAVDFLQSVVPKLDSRSLEPVSWRADPALEWAPPGHGDVYGALRRSGMLAQLLEQGFEYVMISNSDNLGATADPRIAAYLVEHGAPFLLEVVEGTKAERKGGHIARRRDGRLVLRESVQVPPHDTRSFGDYRHWRYFNTNNLWVKLRSLAELLDRQGGVLELPLIANRKTVDPRDADSPAVVQLESAMGAAIGVFPGARVLCVPRTRFAPVKTTDDLLLVRSDVYSLTAEWHLEPLRERARSLPFVELDPAYYKLLDRFDDRFPAGAPSLREAVRFVVHGDVTFEGGVVVRGSVQLRASEPLRIDRGAVLEG